MRSTLWVSGDLTKERRRVRLRVGPKMLNCSPAEMLTSSKKLVNFPAFGYNRKEQ
jgi:hypothetical protein